MGPHVLDGNNHEEATQEPGEVAPEGSGLVRLPRSGFEGGRTANTNAASAPFPSRLLPASPKLSGPPPIASCRRRSDGELGDRTWGAICGVDLLRRRFWCAVTGGFRWIQYRGNGNRNDSPSTTHIESSEATSTVLHAQFACPQGRPVVQKGMT